MVFNHGGKLLARLQNNTMGIKCIQKVPSHDWASEVHSTAWVD
jgi:hypothetical protein